MINITPEKVTESTPNDGEVVLSVEGVSKKFCRDLKRSLFYGVQDIAGDLTGIRRKSDRLRNKEFWALDNVSFQLKRGESLGLVGKNGSGKSTLLRIIAGLIKPDLGTVKITGRVAPLIALGAGFNPILTGRENIYANMSILGLSTKEINERFDDVVEFAEIGDAIDAPVQTYSSGMAARLGFSSAIHTEPDILLIDEVLAVGDIRFRKKCIQRLYDLRDQGTSYILVSHNSYAILNSCESAVYLSKGVLKKVSDSNSVIRRYEEDLFAGSKANVQGSMILPTKQPSESSGLDIKEIFLVNENSEKINVGVSGQPLGLSVKCLSSKIFSDVSLSIIVAEISGEKGRFLYLDSSDDDVLFEVPEGESILKIQMPCLSLAIGQYCLSLFVRGVKSYPLDTVERFNLVVQSNEKGRHIMSKVYQPREWKITTKKYAE